MIETLHALGGGELQLCYETLTWRRLGGSTQEKINYVGQYKDKRTKEPIFGKSVSEYKKILMGDEKTRILPVSYMADTMKINWRASPGCVWKGLGLRDKEESTLMALDLYHYIFYSWCNNVYSPIHPKEILSTGSRPKLIKLEKAMLKATKQDPICRVITVCSPMEQMIGYPLYHGLSELLLEQFLTKFSGVCIGVKRLSRDWAIMGSKLWRSKFVYTGDWSKYDTTVPADVIEYSLDILMEGIEKDEYSSNYISNFRRWFTNNMVNKKYVIDKSAIGYASQGIPSGSLWTSVLNSVCNYVIIDSILTEMEYKRYEILVYGDDHMICFYEEQKDNFKEDFFRIAEERYNLKGSPDDAVISTGDRKWVGYKQPVYEPGDYLKKGTRSLRPRRWIYGREKATVSKVDHSKGLTHRWYYDFNGRPRFLQYYWLKDGNPIRSTFDVINRIVNPEGDVKSIRDHQDLLVGHLIDNIYNEHVVNKIFHYLYDVNFQKVIPSNGRRDFYANWSLRTDNVYSRRIKGAKPLGMERSWYRRVDEYVNLYAVPELKWFVDDFNKLVVDGMRIYRKLNRQNIYECKGTLQEIRKRGGYDSRAYREWMSNYHRNEAMQAEKRRNISTVHNDNANAQVLEIYASITARGLDYVIFMLDVFSSITPESVSGIADRVFGEGWREH